MNELICYNYFIPVIPQNISTREVEKNRVGEDLGWSAEKRVRSDNRLSCGFLDLPSLVSKIRYGDIVKMHECLPDYGKQAGSNGTKSSRKHMLDIRV